MASAVVQSATDPDGGKWVSVVFQQGWTIQTTPQGTTVELMLAAVDAGALADAIRKAAGAHIETARAIGPLVDSTGRPPPAWRK